MSVSLAKRKQELEKSLQKQNATAYPDATQGYDSVATRLATLKKDTQKKLSDARSELQSVETRK